MPTRKLSRIVDEIVDSDVLVVGGGFAGAIAALTAERHGAGRVTLVDKGKVARSGSSAFAAGNLLMKLPEEDTLSWLREIVEGGEFLNDQEWVKLTLERTFPIVMEVEQWGKQHNVATVVRNPDGTIPRFRGRGNLQSHQCNILSIPFMETLKKQLRRHRVRLVQNVMVTRLIAVEGRVVGALGLEYRTGRLYFLSARQTILASGGCGFKANYFGHKNLTGDSQAMAYDIGASFQSMEMFILNTTAKDFDIHGLNTYVGMGGKFVNALDEEFLWRYTSTLGSKASLPLVTSAMANEVRQGRGPCYMDLTSLTEEKRQLLRRLQPEAFKVYERAGVDPFGQKMEWIPAFQGTISGGGLAATLDCRTDPMIPGLFVAGDVTYSPVHGTYSVGGISIAFALTSGEVAGHSAARANVEESLAPPVASDVLDAVEQAVAHTVQPAKTRNGPTAEGLIREMFDIFIPHDVLIIRQGDRLERAIEKTLVLKDKAERVTARGWHDLVKANEVRDMIVQLEAVLRSALYRRESRGYLREDYPFTDNRNWLKWVLARKGPDGTMQMEVRDVPTPYVRPEKELDTERWRWNTSTTASAQAVASA